MFVWMGKHMGQGWWWGAVSDSKGGCFYLIGKCSVLLRGLPSPARRLHSTCQHRTARLAIPVKLISRVYSTFQGLSLTRSSAAPLTIEAGGTKQHTKHSSTHSFTEHIIWFLPSLWKYVYVCPIKINNLWLCAMRGFQQNRSHAFGELSELWQTTRLRLSSHKRSWNQGIGRRAYL
jgi:hypothetical protein